ncbi:Iduronate-2-sulfatase protein [Halorhabdus tiamatea SARL4B]|nr:Iduronate-2-sulfatase protein [Halorhabdus tiamatea SARL4B]
MVTAPELLSDIGYHTVGVSENGYAGVAKEFDKRFDDFVKSSPSSLSDFISYQQALSFLKYSLQTRKHGPGLSVDVGAHGDQNSFFTTDITKRKLRNASVQDCPIFAYVHYNDPHHPYIPPLAYRDEYLEDIDVSADEAVAFAERMHEDLYKWIANDLPLSEKEWEILYAMYDATIRYTDAMVGNLFNFVQEQLDDTIVVITADHGDLFGEYGLLGHHMVLHDGVIHIPLVTHGLEGVIDHSEQPTQHIDVMQTLLAAVGADTTQFQGYDIRDESRDIAISQDLRGTVENGDTANYERIRQYNADVDLSHLPKSMVSSFRTTEHKLVRTDEWTRLYELQDETTDVSDEYPDVLEELDSFADDWMAAEGQSFKVDPEEADLSEQTEQHLQDMGYM